MGGLAKALKALLKNPHVRSDAPVKVVIALKKELCDTVSRVADTVRAQEKSRAVLRASGLSAHVLRSESFAPRHILAGRKTVTAEVAVADLEKFAKSPAVEYVRPMRLHKMHLDVSVPMLGVDVTVTKEFDGSGVRVAVIDSGIDATHPDLKGRVRLDLSRNFTSEGAATDVHDGNGHGTHVAGIIGGAGAKYRGVAPGVEFISCKVFDSQGRAGDEGAIQAAVGWAVDHGAEVINYSGGYSPIDADGNVLVDPPWVWQLDLMEEEVEFANAMDRGIVSVVSAGNDGDYGRRATLSMPATCPAVISVGATDKNRKLDSFSSVGPALRSAKVSPKEIVLTLSAALRPVKSFPEVDLIVPGGGVDYNAAKAGACFYTGGIISLLAKNAVDMKPICFVDKRYVRLSGTSQAAPHVTGLSALILQAAKKLGANLGPKRAYVVKGILRKASTKIAGYTRFEQGKGFPAWSAIRDLLDDLASGKTSPETLLKA